MYHHVAIANGSKQVHIAGQVGWDVDGNLVALIGVSILHEAGILIEAQVTAVIS